MVAKKNKAKTKHIGITPLKPVKDINIWMISTVVLGILLVTSLFMNSSNSDVDDIISDLNTIKTKTSDTNLKSTIESVVASLEPYTATVEKEYDGEKLVIVEYSDYQCPFCQRAEDDAVAKIKENFGDAVEFEYKHFPLSFHPNAQKAAEASECARDQNKFWEYHAILFKNQQSLGVDNLKKYAKDLGLDADTFNACLDNNEKATLVQAQMAEGQSKGVSGTPAFFIGESMISGAQPYENFLPVICKEIPDHEACKNVPKSVAFKMYVIEDKNCDDCDSTQILSVTRQLFSGVEVVKLDYNTKEGKKLYDEAGLVYMPMYIMEKGVADDPNYARISGAMQEVGDYLVILPAAVGATYDPNAEKCTNGIDDNNDGVVDCDDARCAASLECREEKLQDIQLFIMSDCPYGKKAVEGLKEAVDNFGASMNFDIHYIAGESGDSFNSLHGQYEWEENVRQLCAKELAPETYFDYVYCRSVNGIKGVDWKSCATSSGIDVDAMQSCFDGQGKDLLREDIKIANALGIGASPTWLANNRYQFSGLDGETVRSNFCKYNAGVEGCDNTLSTDTTLPDGAGCET